MNPRGTIMYFQPILISIIGLLCVPQGHAHRAHPVGLFRYFSCCYLSMSNLFVPPRNIIKPPKIQKRAPKWLIFEELWDPKGLPTGPKNSHRVHPSGTLRHRDTLRRTLWAGPFSKGTLRAPFGPTLRFFFTQESGPQSRHQSLGAHISRWITPLYRRVCTCIVYPKDITITLVWTRFHHTHINVCYLQKWS